VQEAVRAFAERIQAFKPRVIKQGDDKIFYTAGVLRLVSNVNLLYAISEGEIKIEKKEHTLIVHYVIRFHELVALSIIPAVGALVVMDSIIGKVIGLLLVVLFSYGGNVLITILRYKRFIKNTADAWLEERKSIPISEEQKEWIENPNKCDGCGYSLSATDILCPDCGLTLR
jgi:hypothetical protein